MRPDRASVRRVLDLGTGTGALLLAALAEYPAALGVGIDRNPAACALAARNAARNGLADRAVFACADWTAPLHGTFGLILANPPYIPRADLAGLMPEVAVFEPELALDGGGDGLEAFRVILAARRGIAGAATASPSWSTGPGRATPSPALPHRPVSGCGEAGAISAGSPAALILDDSGSATYAPRIAGSRDLSDRS